MGDPAQAPSIAPAEAPAPATAPAPAPAEAKDEGSPRAALRASRRAERQLREENATLRKQLEAAGSTAAADVPTEPDEGQLNDVREYAPDVGAAFDRLKVENDRLRALAPPAPGPAPAYAPDVLPPEVQEAVDGIAVLSDWQSLPEHAATWQDAKKADAYLEHLPQWKDRPLAERFAEVVRRIQAETAGSSQAAPAPMANDVSARAIAAASPAPAQPVTRGDLRGGQPRASVSPKDPYQMVKEGKTDEKIMASLPPL